VYNDSSTPSLTLALERSGCYTPQRLLYHRARDSVPIVQGLGVPHDMDGRGVENLEHTGIQLPELPALSEWLYSLRYPGPMKPLLLWRKCINCKVDYVNK
jgi:hypothetical protein